MEVFISVLVRLAYIAAACLIPGSFVVIVAVWVWRGLRRALGFKKPKGLPLRLQTGTVIYSEADWHKDARAEFPVRYALFEALPALLGRLEKRLRALKPRPRGPKPAARTRILFQAFNVFSDWVEARSIEDLPVTEDEEGPVARFNTRMAEVRSLHDWWTVQRPARVASIEEQDSPAREFSLTNLELDDQHNLARLVNIWRDLT